MGRRRFPVTWLAAAVLLVGSALMFVQQTDPRFPLVYFTVDSALLCAIVIAPRWDLSAGWPRAVRGASVVGVLVSGLVYAIVIAPSTPSGSWFQPHDDTAVRSATVLLHLVGPVLVVADFLVRDLPRQPLLHDAMTWTWWPSVYIGAIAALASTGVVANPYPFLRPSEQGWPAVLVAVGILWLVVVTSTLSIVAMHRRLHPS